jgi:nucleotide-binding universal stress UspA family protein
MRDLKLNTNVMKTILVPTDFSKASKVAVLFAIGIAKKIKASIILLSVINANSSTMRNWKKLERELIKIAQQDADKLLSEVKAETATVAITYHPILGFPIEDRIEQFAVDNKVDFIVMGTKGATGLKKTFMGNYLAKA